MKECTISPQHTLFFPNMDLSQLNSGNVCQCLLWRQSNKSSFECSVWSITFGSLCVMKQENAKKRKRLTSSFSLSSWCFFSASWSWAYRRLLASLIFSFSCSSTLSWRENIEVKCYWKQSGICLVTVEFVCACVFMHLLHVSFISYAT